MSIESLRLRVSENLAGVPVQASSGTETVEQYLFEVAKEKLKRAGNFVPLTGTKSLKFLNSTDTLIYARGLVNIWLQFARSIKNSSGTEEETLKALLNFREEQK